MFASQEILFTLCFVVFVVEPEEDMKLQQKLVRFTHFSSRCRVKEDDGSFACHSAHNLISCGRIMANGERRCHRFSWIDQNSNTFTALPGFQYVNDLDCGQGSKVVSIHSIVYKIPKENKHLCPSDNTPCVGLDEGSCKSENCTTKAKVAGVETCDMDDDMERLRMARYCNKSGSFDCAGYKLLRKPIKDYYRCLNEKNDVNCGDSSGNTIECYAVAAQINYNCVGKIVLKIIQLCNLFIFG